jgi:F-type H+-transporting ATPase subunit delta
LTRHERILVRRYARAVIDLAFEQGAPTARRARTDLEALRAVMLRHRDLRAALEDPRVPPASRRSIVEAVCDQMGLSPLVRGLAALLAERGRALMLPALAEASAAEFAARQGIVSARATGAVPLTAEQRGGLEAALRRASGLEVELETRVDPDVIGGLRVKMGDTIYDGTVRAQLAALRLCLASGR